MANITNVEDLIKLQDSGLTIADYTDIVNFLIYKYKQIYGNDIDVDPRTADGRFIECVATIMWNGFRSVQEMYNSLDPAIATGKFLDIICSLSNVRRKSAIHSLANITLKNVSSSGSITFNSRKDIDLMDVSGNLWQVKNFNSFTLGSNKSIDLIYECKDTGRIKTSSLKLVALNSNIEIELKALEVGDDEESDNELRARRNSFATQSFTALEGLQGYLLDIDGVEDVLVYSNNTVGELTTDDTTTIPRASCYIVLRYNKVLIPNDTTIGKAIIDYMTPGIYTAKMGSSVKNGTQHTYETSEKLTTQDVANWKVATPVSPDWKITISILDNWSETTLDIIASKLEDYLNNLKINTKINKIDIVNLINGCDPKTNGNNTFFLNVDGLSETTEFEKRTNLDTYYRYANLESMNKVYSYDSLGKPTQLVVEFGEA